MLRFLNIKFIFLIFFLVFNTYAGDYHTSTNNNLICSDCHSIHYSEAGAQIIKGSAGGPFASLLVRNSINTLCLMCHDGSNANAPNVNDAATYTSSAGKFAPGGIPTEENRHSLGSVSVASGGTWSNANGLNCTNCHNPHGNSYYRNLRDNPGGISGKKVTYMTGATYSGTYAIQQTASTPLSTHYSVNNIKYRQTQNGVTDYGISEWCSGCHTNYHGSGGSVNMGGSATGDNTTTTYWLKHPTRDVSMQEASTNKHIDIIASTGTGYWFTGLLSRVPIVSNNGTIPGTKTASDNEVFCGSCHKAHGSTHKNNLIWDDPTTAGMEDGTNKQQLCQQCHYK